MNLFTYHFKKFYVLYKQVMAGDRKPYHRGCVKCFQCRVNLTPRNLNNHDDQLFCNVCYENIFNPADFTVDMYTGIITPEDIERWEKQFLKKIIESNENLVKWVCSTLFIAYSEVSNKHATMHYYFFQEFFSSMHARVRRILTAHLFVFQNFFK